MAGAAPQPLGLPGVGELRPLSRARALALGPRWSHAGRALLFAPDPGRLFGRIPLRYAVLMQLQFDGQLGFPGGFVDQHLYSLEEGLNRALSLGLGRSLCLGKEDYLVSHLAQGPRRLVAHLYSKQLSLTELRALELQAVQSHDHGLEVMGMVRVPLYTQKDRLGGLASLSAELFCEHSQVPAALRTQSLEHSSSGKAGPGCGCSTGASEDGLRSSALSSSGGLFLSQREGGAEQERRLTASVADKARGAERSAGFPSTGPLLPAAGIRMPQTAAAEKTLPQ